MDRRAGPSRLDSAIGVRERSGVKNHRSAASRFQRAVIRETARARLDRDTVATGGGSRVDGRLIRDRQVSVADVPARALNGLCKGELLAAGAPKNEVVGVV